MANKYLKRRFNLREIILMIILLAVLFIGLYLWLVYYPLRDRSDEVQREAEELQLQIDIERAREARYDAWKKELEEIAKVDPSEQTFMPKYSNDHELELTGKFIDIFAGIAGGMNGSNVQSSDGVYKRNVSFTFTVTNENKGTFATPYLKVKDVLHKLTHTGWRCQMTNLSFGDTKADSMTVSCNIVFYEVA